MCLIITNCIGANICPDSWPVADTVVHMNSCYLMDTAVSTNFNSAGEACDEIGGQLAVIDSIDEYSAIKTWLLGRGTYNKYLSLNQDWQRKTIFSM